MIYNNKCHIKGWGVPTQECSNPATMVSIHLILIMFNSTQTDLHIRVDLECRMNNSKVLISKECSNQIFNSHRETMVNNLKIVTSVKINSKIWVKNWNYLNKKTFKMSNKCKIYNNNYNHNRINKIGFFNKKS